MIDLSAPHLEQVLSILNKNVPELNVYAFGSRVRKGAKPFSDLDLVLMTEHPLPINRLAALKEEFSESNLPFKVDLVDWAQSHPAFRKIIENQKVPVKLIKPSSSKNRQG